MKPIACVLLASAMLIACDSDQDSADRVFGTDAERAAEQERLNAISEQDDDMNADAGITNDAQMQPLNP
jgi:hypothetical protein